MSLRKALLAITIATLVSACATHRGAAPDREGAPGPAGTFKIGNPYEVGGVWYYPKEDPGYDETGVASWYGAEFHGKATANGERYDMNALTAAHRTLPMPSYVRVTNLENGRGLVLKINDRGPFAKERIIDVSRRAAQLLGFETNGVTKVRVQAVARETSPQGAPKAAPDPDPPPRAESASEPGRLFVQVGAFGEPENADAATRRVGRLGAVKTIKVEVHGQAFYRVRIGPFGSVADADSTLAKVMAEGFTMALIVVD